MGIHYWINVRAPNGWITTLQIYTSTERQCDPLPVAAGPNGGVLVSGYFAVQSPGPPVPTSETFVIGRATVELFASPDRHVALVTLES